MTRLGAVVLGFALLLPGSILPAQQRAQPHARQRISKAASALVFDGVTVVDVENGQLLASQRVVIVGNRIQAVGPAAAVTLPKGARVIPAHHQYLIPGLWDMHVHTASDFAYPLFLANGITGIRDAWAGVPLDTMVQWRREILAGTRLGPPRQLLSGAGIDETGPGGVCTWHRTQYDWRRFHTCVAFNDTANAGQLVDSLAAGGADIIKSYTIRHKAVYFALLHAAQRRGLLFGGHMAEGVSREEAADSGVNIEDHGPLDRDCGLDVDDCPELAERLTRHNTWVAPTMTQGALHGGASPEIHGRIVVPFYKVLEQLWTTGTIPRGNWLATGAAPTPPAGAPERAQGSRMSAKVGLPILASTDVMVPYWFNPPGFLLHVELAWDVAMEGGLTPLEALQSATLNPAKLLHGTDSLGTVAAGKLADLVLLNANPLDDITNTTTIGAVVANGRYFDRAALDSVLRAAQRQATQEGIRQWESMTDGPDLARVPSPQQLRQLLWGP